MSRTRCPSVVWLSAVLLVGGVAQVAAAADGDSLDGKRCTLQARVVMASGGSAYVMAEQQPARFTIPKGYRATAFKYSFHDPKSGYESQKLSSGNLRVVHGFVSADVGAADFSLGPGEYIFVVGGFPGAVGTLSYTLTRSEDLDDPSGAGRRTIEVVIWSPAYSQHKQKATYHVDGGKVRGEMHDSFEYPKSEYWTCGPLITDGTFTGEISGHVITGVWKMRSQPHRMHFFGTDHPDWDRVDTFTQTLEVRVVLHSDGSLTETVEGSGVTELQWGPTAPDVVAGKHETNRYKFSIPGEDHPQSIVGEWNEKQ
ncbi:MAG: hypothetical protein RIC55_11895 [Pirellulaceae bacterium]